MIIIDDKIISDDLIKKEFVCDLAKCKGACCVQGDGGAPLTEEERDLLPKIYSEVEPYITEEGKAAIKNKGFSEFDKEEGTWATPLRDSDTACVYVGFDENQVAYCGIEKAYLAGKIDFKKPVSCHLYPIRTKEYEEFEAINYEKWDICSAACQLGEQLKVPVYAFLKAPLIRKYGEEFYSALDAYAQHVNQEGE